MPTIPCQSPATCRVKFHRDTTEAKCLSVAGSKSSGSRKLGGVSLLTSNPNELKASLLESTIVSRGQAPEFHDMLRKRTELQSQLDDMKAQTDAEKDPFAKTKLKRLSKELYIQKLLNKDDIETYKDETATKYVHPLNKLNEGRIVQFEGETLGDCVKTIKAPSGSRAWLEQRQKGIGGSDVGSIIGTGGRYADSNYDEVFASKVNPITDEEVQVQTQEGVGGAIGRGNIWEQRVFDRFQDENPYLELMLTKDSWVNKDNAEQVINVDGLISDTGDGVPNGIFEAKTSSRPDDWEEGVPDGYKAQVQWYLRSTGFKYAYVGVMIDDHEYRQYRINANDPVTTNSGTKPFDEYMPEIEAFQAAVKDHLEGGGAKFTTSRAPQKSVFKKMNPTALNNLSAYRDEDPQITQDLINQEVSSGKTLHNAVTGLYRDFDPSTRKRLFAYVDLETSSLSATTGDIIEFGVTVRNHKNEVVKSFEKLYSPDPRILDITGTGAEDVHQITSDAVRGLPMFTDPASMAEVNEVMKDTIMIAHNKSFEEGWLNVNLEGFQEAEIPTIDTMHISRYMVPDSNANTLESFAVHHGVPYENSHRALPDANMTADALFAWETALRS